MATIECSDCGSTVSTRAAACPSCGCPVSAKASSRGVQTIQKTGKRWKAYDLLGVAAITVGTIMILGRDDMESFDSKNAIGFLCVLAGLSVLAVSFVGKWWYHGVIILMVSAFVAASPVAAQAETDAEKIVRLEKENYELREDVARMRQVIAILQRRVESLMKPAGEGGKPDAVGASASVPAKAVRIAKPIDSVEAFSATIPAEKLPPAGSKAMSELHRAVFVEWLDSSVPGVAVKLTGKVSRVGVEMRRDEKIIVVRAIVMPVSKRVANKLVDVSSISIEAAFPFSRHEDLSKIAVGATCVFTGDVADVAISGGGSGNDRPSVGVLFKLNEPDIK